MRPKMGHLTAEERRLARRLRDQGKTFREIGAAIGCSRQCAHWAVTRPSKRRLPTPLWQPSSGHLSLAEREEISFGIRSGASHSSIARSLGRSISTVSREVAANGGRGEYRAWRAHERAECRSKRPKPHKFDHQPLVDQVSTWLGEWWSPKAIARPIAPRVPTRSDDVGEPRDHLLEPLCARARRAATRAREVSPHWSSPAPLPRPAASRGTVAEHGDDLGTPARGRRPRRPRTLGRRPHHREGQRLCCWHPRRTFDALRDAPASP